MAPREEPVRWQNDGTELVGVLHHPDEDPPVASAVIVHPFAEEKKFSHRVFVNLSRELARRNVASLRFDLSACGDSFGDSADATVGRWLSDVASARSEMSARFPESPQVMVGLRLGATLALAAAAGDDSPVALVLWEPIINGGKYVNEILRRRMIKEMMTTGRKATTRDNVRAQLDADGFLDLDGIAVGRRLVDDIAALDATALAGAFTGKALCVQIVFNAKVSSSLEALARKMRASGADVEAVGIREQIIWDRVELVEAAELIEVTAQSVVEMTA